MKSCRMEVPSSMIEELSSWNSDGIDLAAWTGCTGNFRLAVGYSTVYWPTIVAYGDYLFREGFTEDTVRGFEAQPGSTKKSVEWIINHVHIADLQHPECDDLTKDKIIYIGSVLHEIYSAKLAWLFPDRPCRVQFYRPVDEEDLFDYQLSFWQITHEA